MAEILWEDRKRTLFGLPLSFTKYRLTEERLFVTTGFLSTNEDEVRLYRILDLRLRRTLGQRIFGLGTIIIASSDKSLGEFELKNIKRSSEVKELLSNQVEEQRDKKRVVSREYMSEHDDEDDEDNE